MEAMDVARFPTRRAGRALEAGGYSRRRLCGAGDGPPGSYAGSHDSLAAGAVGEGRYRAGREDARRSGYVDSSHAGQLALGFKNARVLTSRRDGLAGSVRTRVPGRGTGQEATSSASSQTT